MERVDHLLPGQSIGHQTTLTSLHFGTPGARPKVYMQASLHADELPGMLAIHHLRPLLEHAEAHGELVGEVVLVPVANPIGLAQRVDHKPMGRFELGSSENFNRHYPALADAVWPALDGRFGADAKANVALVRAALAQYLAAWQPKTALDGQRKQLLVLAQDANIVLDLHCDFEAVLHMYTETPCWPLVEPLARLLQARAVLLAEGSGNVSFDECLSGLWWGLGRRLAAQQGTGAAPPLPQACISSTVELRGEADVTHAHGIADAQALFTYLRHVGVVRRGPAPLLPTPSCAATPLAGTQELRAPCAGMLVFAAAPGDTLRVDQPVADIVDPVSGIVTIVRAEVEGVLYARASRRYALPGDKLGNIAGNVAFRSGNLLSA